MSAIPSIIPVPSINFVGKVAVGTIRTKMDSGRFRSRRRFTRVNYIYAATWEMTDFEYGIFQAWLAYDVAGGSIFFNIDLPTGGEGLKTVSARLVDGLYTGNHKAIMNWSVTASLEVENGAILEQDAYSFELITGDITLLEIAAADAHAYTLT